MTNALTITLTIKSTAQLAAVEAALELFADMESDRLKDEAPGDKSSAREMYEHARDVRRQKAAVELLKSISEGK